MPMAYCRVLLCNINKKSSCCNGGFLFISNKHLVTFHFLLAIYRRYRKFYSLPLLPVPASAKKSVYHCSCNAFTIFSKCIAWEAFTSTASPFRISRMPVSRNASRSAK